MKNSEPLIQIFCKSPISGGVKTRLIEKLGPEGSLELYIVMLERLITNITGGVYTVELWISPDVRHPYFDKFSLKKCRQKGADLGIRMRAALDDGLKKHEKVILIGADLPEIDSEYLGLAVKALDENCAVLAPTEDGGYGLVGLFDDVPDIFSDVDWSTSSVLSQTCEKLNEQKISYGLLPLIWDIDRPEDLPRYWAWVNGRLIA
jgi:uncharacterized protein